MIRRATIAAAFAGVFLWPAAASGQTDKYVFLSQGQQIFLALVDDVEIVLTDQVSGGCWPRPAATRDAVELQLRNSGFTVKNNYFNRLHIIGLGYKSTSGLCVVHLTLRLDRPSLAAVPYAKSESLTSIDLILADKAHLMSGPQYSLQRQVTDLASENITAIILEIKKARESVFTKYPDYEKRVREIRKSPE